MLPTKEKVTLTAAQETLLITLYSRVHGAPRSVFDDPHSRAMMERIEYDFSQLKVPNGTRLTVCLRAKKFDQYAREFLAQHPAGTILHLGCGLDTRFARVDNGQATWYDLDLPDVIELRRKLVEEGPRYHMLASSAADLDWLDAIPRSGQPVLVIAEGLMMYLPGQAVKALVLKLQSCFPGCHLTFDSYSMLTVRNINRHPSIRKTGAVIQWGVDDAHEIEGWGQGIQLREEWSYTQSEDIPQLDFGSRLLFAITGAFALVRRAHRLLYFTL